MTGLPAEPRERIGDSGVKPASPRHDPLSRISGRLTAPSTDRTPIYERAVQHLSRWAGPAVLIGTVLLIGWWIVR
ncbi:hypothetical protein MOK15_08450 [Sphingobium sp. BYY-5]|uniref:hypothetical protein n=1 Tax=Sphingobium sp. BYY-5 TaxID=2926400 RepID=UPI001FA6EC72|nr:hypothetical protein [Sphingobium sp. BYY-5]MCI4590124.1 hypothetical protein [Sphingobium sp. BYY-5]